MEASNASTVDQCNKMDTYTLTVIFHNNEQFYSPEEDLTCSFSFKDNFSVEDLSECFISLFKVGWENCQDYVTCVRVSGCDTSSNDAHVQFKKGEIYTVKFPCNALPHSDNECYQFCFLWQNSVLGASQPFQFQEFESSGTEASDIEIIKEGDLEWWYESCGKQLQRVDSEEAVMVQNERTILEDTLARVMEENSILKGWKKEAQSEIDCLKEHVSDLESQKIILEKILLEKSNKVANSSQELLELHTTIKNLESKIEHFVEKETHLKSRISTVESQLKESEEEVKDLLGRIEEEKGEEKSKLIRLYEMKLSNMREIFQEADSELSYAKMERDNLNGKYLEERQEFEKQLQELYAKVKYNEEKMLEVTLEKEDLISKVIEEKEAYVMSMKQKDEEIKNLNEKLAGVKEVNEKLCNSSEKAIRDLQAEVASTFEKLHIVEAKKSCIESELALIKEGTNTKSTLEQELKTAKEDVVFLTNSARLLEEDLKLEKQKHEDLKDKFSKSNGARHALKVAYAHVQHQSTGLRAEKEELSKMLQNLKKQMSGTPLSAMLEEQTKEIEDLKLRLCMGLNAYKEKFMECRKLQHEVRKFRRSPSTSSETSISSTNTAMPWKSFNESSQAFPKPPAPDVTDVGNRASAGKGVLNDEVEMLRQENEKLHSEIETLRCEVVKLRSELSDAERRSSLLDARMAEKKKEGDEGMKRSVELTREIRRLEDSLHSKDMEIRLLKQKAEERDNLSNVPASSLPGLLEMKDKHRKKVEKLQLECDKYKKILQGVNRVVEASSNKETGTVIENDQEVEETGHDDIRRPLVHGQTDDEVKIPDMLLQEPHMSPIRDFKVSDAGYIIFKPGESVNGNPKNETFTNERKDKSNASVRLKAPSQDFPYPWIYGQAKTDPPITVPGNVLRRPHDKPTENRSNRDFGKKHKFKEAWIRPSRHLMEPIVTCPVCQKPFPPDFSDISATEHVNSHFEFQT